MSNFKMPQPRIGDELLWYPRSDMSNKPFILKVTEVGVTGLAGLVFRHGLPTLLPVDGVRHADDPIHNEVPRPECSVSNGCWKFKPWDSPTVAVPEAAKPAAKPSPLEPDIADDLEVLHLRYNKKFPPSVIAQRMGGAWNTASVRKVLDRYGDQQAMDLLLDKMPQETADARKEANKAKAELVSN